MWYLTILRLQVKSSINEISGRENKAKKSQDVSGYFEPENGFFVKEQFFSFFLLDFFPINKIIRF